MRVKDILSTCGVDWLPGRSYDAAKPAVSVLLPTFRRGESGLFMKAALSVLDQSLKDIELIVVDDASTDGTAAQIVALMAGDGRVSCLRHRKNVGLPAISEYEAYLKARADYLAFAFDDDEFYPDALAQLLGEATAAGASLVYGHVDLHVYDPAVKKQVVIPRFGAVGYPQALLASGNFISNNAVLMHRRVVETVGLYDPHVAIARLCDWDLWRRAAGRYELRPVDVAVGRVLGPSTTDSLGHTYAMEPWQAIEWMSVPRDQFLLPEAFPEYDVTGIPDALTRQTRVTIEEIVDGFRAKHWFLQPGVREPGTPVTDTATATADPAADGRILVLNVSHDASLSLYFEHLPPFLQQRVRVLHRIHVTPAELVGASAVVIVRDIPGFRDIIDHARLLKVPLYYFLDDNLPLLRREPAYRSSYDFYSEESLRRELQDFSGVLLSTEPLVDFFREYRIHDRLHLFPPVAKDVVFSEPVRRARREGSVHVGFFGGPHRLEALSGIVHPAVVDLARQRPVDLFISGMTAGSLPESGDLKIHYLPFELSYDLALGRFAACGIDVLVHPSSVTVNNPFKTCAVLINAMVMGAVPVVSRVPPYDDLGKENVALLCGSDVRSWTDALRAASADGGTADEIRGKLRRYCMERYGGRRNSEALMGILGSHPAPGFAVRDRRFRALLEIARREAMLEGRLSTVPARLLARARLLVHDIVGRLR